LSSLAIASNGLIDNEKATYSDSQADTEISKGVAIGLKEIEESLTDKVIENTVRMFLLVRKPDFLGDSKWEFKHDKNPLLANIADQTWIESFREGSIALHPGDSMEIELHTISKYNRNGLLISQTNQITKVYGVIHNTKHSQSDFI
jgi:hypothetical protein